MELMKRRDFMTGVVAAGTFAAAIPGWAQNRSTSNENKKSRIALMMFGLNSLVKNNFPPSPERTIDLLDIGQLAADRYGLHQVELQSNYFPSTEMSWLKDFKARLAKTKTQIVQINLEFGTDDLRMTVDNPSRRLQMIDLHRSWIEKAAFLGCPRLLLNQGQPSQANKELAISNYKAVVAIAKPKNIKCASENRNAPGGGQGRAGAPGAPASQAAPPPGPSYPLLVEILRAAGAYTCVDFQNFPNENEQHEGIRAEIPYSSGLLHAGMRHDLSKALAITRELKYPGIYSIKAGGGAETNPLDTTQKILDVLLAEI
jgi:hypothetical protein